MRTSELTTPALLVDAQLLEDNIRTMSDALPGSRLRPHVKAHKCTELAKRQAAAGHSGFTCATVREMEGMVRAGLGHDLLLANEVADASRLGVLAREGARITVAVDSDATIDAVARAGVAEVLIDVNVGLPRCGCPPEEAGRLADRARAAGLSVRGVMGYEGHIVGLEDRSARAAMLEDSMGQLVSAAGKVGGEVISALLGHRDSGCSGHRSPSRLMDHGDPSVEGSRGVVLFGRAPDVRSQLSTPGWGPRAGAPGACRPHRGVPRLPVRGRRR
jgi:D-serine deaminase-like pyridoxal phosphate-dependent protein